MTRMYLMINKSYSKNIEFKKNFFSQNFYLIKIQFILFKKSIVFNNLFYIYLKLTK